MMPSNPRALARMTIWTAAVCLAAVGLQARVPPQTPTQTEGERVVAIRVVSEAGEVLEENPGLPAQPGQPLDSEAVRESLRQLYRTGRYADLREIGRASCRERV